MKKINQIGIFYKRNGKWTGPWGNETWKEGTDLSGEIREARFRLKSKVKLFCLCWKAR